MYSSKFNSVSKVDFTLNVATDKNKPEKTNQICKKWSKKMYSTNTLFLTTHLARTQEILFCCCAVLLIVQLWFYGRRPLTKWQKKDINKKKVKQVTRFTWFWRKSWPYCASPRSLTHADTWPGLQSAAACPPLQNLFTLSAVLFTKISCFGLQKSAVLGYKN